MAPRKYITATTAPAAITKTCSTLPPIKVQRSRHLASTASTAAATASTAPAVAAGALGACCTVSATGIASPMTTASMISTVAQSRFTRAPGPVLPARPR